MNHRERALAAMAGQPVDHVPFIGRMDLWYTYHHNRGTLPPPYGCASLWEIQRDLDMGIFGLGSRQIPYVTFYRLDTENVEVDRDLTSGVTTTCYHTPYGDLICRDSMAEELADAAVAGGARTEFPFKTARDYDALQYLLDNTRVQPNLDAFGRFVAEIGNDGLAVPVTGHLPAHQLMLSYMGYQRFYYELFDNPVRVERLVESLAEQWRQIIALGAESDADVVQVGGNYDEAMTPPPIFERFFAPLYKEARGVLGAAGKRLAIHGDGEMRQLLSCLMECGVEVVEALTPRPMTSIDIAGTRRLWGDSVTLWGGIATVILTDVFGDEAFESYMNEIFRAVAPGQRFILGFGDNVPTDASFERIKRVVQYWAEHGRYPLPA